MQLLEVAILHTLSSFAEKVGLNPDMIFAWRAYLYALFSLFSKDYKRRERPSEWVWPDVA